MLINEVKILFDYALRRNKKSGRYTIPQFNEMCDLAQVNVMKDQIEKDGVDSFLANSDKSKSLMANDTISISSGTFPYPSDYLHYHTLEHTYSVVGGGNKTTEIGIVRGFEFRRRSNSSLNEPTNEFPIGRYQASGFKVIPHTITSLHISYIKRPEKPTWGHTVANDEEVFDSGSSTDFVLHPSEKNNLVYELLALSGVRLDKADIRNYSTEIKENE